MAQPLEPVDIQKSCVTLKMICARDFSLNSGVPTIMENQMGKKMENEMETGIIQGIIGIRVSQN